MPTSREARLDALLPKPLRALKNPQTDLPRIAKDALAMAMIEAAVGSVPSEHRLYLHDARDMSVLADESVHLIVTSPPYWTLKQYRDSEGQIVPLHASIQEHCRAIGFDNLAPVIWHKIANAAYEVENGSSFLGKPYEPNAVIKNDIEFILLERKPGGYRSPSLATRRARTTSAGFSRSGGGRPCTLGLACPLP